MNNEPQNIEVISSKGTLLIIDILGFDLLHGKFDNVQTIQKFFVLNQQIKEAIRHKGGLVSGNLRSGIEAFFSATPTDAQSTRHVISALTCANHIQKINAKLIVEASKHHLPIFSLRMGMHSSHFTIGKFRHGSGEMICQMGQGYMITKSLNHACHINSILYSHDVARFLEDNKITTNYDNERKIKVIGRPEQIQAYDYDPLEDAEEIKLLAIRALQKLDKRKLENERFNCELDQNVRVKTNQGDFHLLNFSRGGLAIRGTDKIKIGDRLSLSFSFKKEETSSAYTRRVKAKIIEAEARWKRGEKDDIIIGLMYEKINDAQKEALLEFLYDNLELS